MMALHRLLLTSAVLCTMPLRLEGRCACKYQGLVLDESLYAQFPSDEPGLYQELAQIKLYGTMCAAWDAMPGTPWQKSSCPKGADFSAKEHNWCQVPWCYVDESCESRVPSSVFNGSDAFFSYAICGNGPDCFSDGPGGPFGQGTAGCPYDPNGDSKHTVHRGSCRCLYHGAVLPKIVYTEYPIGERGKYEGVPNIAVYGTTCAAWDQSPGSPLAASCPEGSDWCARPANWCQEPWCYVSESCYWATPSTVFRGSTTVFFSYDTCLGSPDCYTKSRRETDWPDLPAACPYDSRHVNWHTKRDCPHGWSEDAAMMQPMDSSRSGTMAAAMLALPFILCYL
eukprot:CAMPEP_0171099982 /NCGR_PEP_ID=MMETSP0766_2-20121228/52685_1 /TAXON_ID=439317 /ORGANISM="Gambierdiscus australes, Strain CAWD 149" /LENGTH=338 /DNA_ID=CAMNT_0011559727 /DNA_START=68 /DNA_END=1084 /DNA_ORIENTATION=-